ncbi:MULTISPECIES: hypothetical protein [unclassified Massilia]|uniref:hypothetical protein n=1 Tax=unclassified Massilia TaxID=2609279 RepID=UPI001782175B|nr:MULTISPECIES: hypothetical protein [unclassified Massilia]MBD8531506.1 hypothetical protein [Massilia sp. CFBP 13647]MBD8673698.1 hypothetical protein [Massilia sp. CFBP 13721]
MEDLLAIAGRQIDTFLDVQTNDEFYREVDKVRRSSDSISFVRSSRYPIALDAACAGLITRCGAGIWEIVHRCITTGRVEFTPSLSEQLKNFTKPYLEGVVRSLTERTSQAANGIFQPTASEVARVRAVANLETEIDLFCAVLSRVPQPAQYQPPHIINIHGSSVASLQTGNHASANVTTLTVGSRHIDVAAALAQLKAELIAAKVDGTPMFLVQEAEAELAKTPPQQSRLKGFVNAIGGCVNGMIEVGTKLPGAIEGAKRAIDMLPM